MIASFAWLPIGELFMALVLIQVDHVTLELAKWQMTDYVIHWKQQQKIDRYFQWLNQTHQFSNGKFLSVTLC